MSNLTEYKDGVTPEANANADPDENFAFGTGEAYGAEFYSEKESRKA